MRYVFAAPIFWLEEVSGLLMIWIVMIGAITAERDGQHLSIPLIMDGLPSRPRAVIGVFVSLLSLAVLLYTSYLGVILALGARTKITSILHISWTWIDLAVPVGALGLSAYMVAHIVRDIRIIAGRGESE
ncbi:TRAP transporter small permease [Consotaella salsifontis]|nr:TRAP transporter small permease [Consotaella salsifontis]